VLSIAWLYHIRTTQGYPYAGIIDLEPGHANLTWAAYIGARLDMSGVGLSQERGVKAMKCSKLRE
jgi:hypothetical protein